jgi:hypothetical protein
MQLRDLVGEVGVETLPVGQGTGFLLMVRGSGDLKQLTRTLDVVVAGLLHGDGRKHVHRVSFAKRPSLA